MPKNRKRKGSFCVFPCPKTWDLQRAPVLLLLLPKAPGCCVHHTTLLYSHQFPGLPAQHSQCFPTQSCCLLFPSVPEFLFHEDAPNSVAVILQPVLNLLPLKLPYASFPASLTVELPLFAPRPQHVPVLTPVWLWPASLAQDNSSSVTFPVKDKVCLLLPPVL